MSRNEFLERPDEAGMARHERAIRVGGVAALAVTVVGFASGYHLLPMVMNFPTGLTESIAFAIQSSVFVLLWVLVAVGMVSTGRRFSPADIGGSAAGPPSERIAVRSAFLQNTLEQAVLAVGAYLAFSTILAGSWLSLVVVSAVLFAVGRLLFWHGYRRGARGRALGMALTITPTALLYGFVVVLLATHLV